VGGDAGKTIKGGDAGSSRREGGNNCKRTGGGGTLLGKEHVWGVERIKGNVVEIIPNRGTGMEPWSEFPKKGAGRACPLGHRKLKAAPPAKKIKTNASRPSKSEIKESKWKKVKL